MPENGFAIPRGRGQRRASQMQAFAQTLLNIGERIGMRVSSRGWAYVLENPTMGGGLITKAQFDLVESLVNEARKDGYLPVDFVAQEDARAFSGIEIPETSSPEAYLASLLRGAMNAENYYTPDWWKGEKYYIQMLVEKIDLVTLFQPVCLIYHIPIATSKGWSSILQRADYARRFSEAEERGLKCVLLVCGDLDPDGLRISETIVENLTDVARVVWSDGTSGYDPSDLIIDRFGLNNDFIQRYGLTWIDNLITGSGQNLASPQHRNFRLPYVQEYLRTYGVRKCEANALLVVPEAARELCENAIVRYLGRDARSRFQRKREAIRRRYRRIDERSGYRTAIQEVIDLAQSREGEGET